MRTNSLHLQIVMCYNYTGEVSKEVNLKDANPMPRVHPLILWIIFALLFSRGSFFLTGPSRLGSVCSVQSLI